jgi:hypothetical protein
MGRSEVSTSVVKWSEGFRNRVSTITRILYIKINVCLFVCMYVCMYLIQIHISEPTEPDFTHVSPLGLE